MRYGLYFYGDKTFNQNAFEAFCKQQEVFDEDSFFEIKKEEGEYCYSIEAYFKKEDFKDIDFQVNFLTAFCKAYTQRVVLDGEWLAPMAYILIEPSGSRSTIAVNFEEMEAGRLTFDCYNDLVFGRFVSSVKFSVEAIQEAMEAIFEGKVNDLRIQYELQKEGRSSFSIGKEKYPILQKMNHFYSLFPLGKNPWFSNKNKAKIFVEGMEKFYQKQQIPIACFPAGFSIIENIPGGSDSEEHLILINEKGKEKIIYKERRKRW